ncbi:hypothetical protein N0V90_008015 [Kalmusia sp. IMI 367209]|nr:hypothetical protein N0V90_008015 [Kalmusia sp. IMI 367209]
MPHQLNHYDTLGVRPTASLREINAAYFKILKDNDPQRVHEPFGRQHAVQREEDARVAWKCLSNPINRWTYDRYIGGDPSSGTSGAQPNGHRPNMKWFNPRPKNGSGPSRDFFSGSDHESTHSRPNNEHDSDCGADASFSSEDNVGEENDDEATDHDEAAYRYMLTDTGTVIDICISKWRLQLNLSPKFRFLNNLTELFDPRDQDNVSFELAMAYDGEADASGYNELTIKIMSLPQSTCSMRIAGFQALFKDTTAACPTLTLTVIAEPCYPHQSCLPWEFGFDFDLGSDVPLDRVGTCLMFSIDVPTGASPEHVLGRDEVLKANSFEPLGQEELMKLAYGNVVMWRWAADKG